MIVIFELLLINSEINNILTQGVYTLRMWKSCMHKVKKKNLLVATRVCDGKQMAQNNNFFHFAIF